MITKFRLSPCFLALLGMGLLCSSTESFSREFFNPAFLTNMNGSDKNPDLSVFETANAQGPGKYRVDVIINGIPFDTTDINFFAIENISSTYIGENEPNTNLYPCLSREALAGYGVRINALPTLQSDSNGCVIIKSIPGATVEFNFNLQKLMLSIPQAAIAANARGYVSPDSFDQGINALFLNYRYNGNNSYSRNNDTSDQDTHSINLLPGLNFGPWRLRNYTTWNKSKDSNNQTNEHWDTVYTYLERNIIAIKSNLTLGETSSESDVFDSVPFRGVQLATDDFMDPESTQGYAPIVRGIAKSNAKVVIKQNGYVIYQSYVPPGAFEIKDLYSTGGNGDLDVTIEEADGSQQEYVVAYASLPVLRREGSLKYGIATGQYHSSDNNVDHTPFTQLTASYGLPFNTTSYGGTQLSSKYQSIVFGLGKNLGELGAISLDVTQAWSTKKDEDKTAGQSLRVRYSKNINEVGTNVSIAGYRYSTSGFNTLSEVMETYRDDYRVYSSDRVKNRTEITVSQSLPDNFGYINIGGVIEDYWNERRRNNSINVGYSNSWKGITYSLNYSHNRSSTDNGSDGRNHATDNLFSLNVNVPLDRWLSNTWVSYGLNTSNPGSTSNSVSISGIALEDKNLNWNVQQQYDNREHSSGNAGINYKNTYGEVFTSYSYDNNWQRVSYGASGSIIAHRNGITAGQPISDTTALVKAPGVENTRIIGNTGVKTDFRGYAIVPNISMYRPNDVILDTETMPNDVELDTTTTTVIPTRGAIVLAEYTGKKGIRAMLQLVDTMNNYIPFGAIVTNVNNQNSNETGAIVSDNGQVYMTGLEPAGTLLVKWGKKSTQSCTVVYQFPDTDNSNGIKQMKLICR